MSFFKKPSELEAKVTIKALIYGNPGMGKSTLALSAPNAVLFDFDGGVHGVNSAFQVPTMQVQSWEEVAAAIDSEEIKQFDTIVFDTAGKMLDYMSAYIIKQDYKMGTRDGSLSLKGYGKRKNLFIEFVKKCTIMGKNLIFVAHEVEDKQGEETKVRPDIGGSSRNDLLKELDFVGYLQSNGGIRTIYWQGTDKFYAKSRGNLPLWEPVPVIVNESGVPCGQNNFLTKMIDNYRLFVENQKQERAKYDDLMETIKSHIDDIKDIDTANEAVKKILSYDAIWDSKVRANALISAKCDSLNLKYNKVTKSYEHAA